MSDFKRKEFSGVTWQQSQPIELLATRDGPWLQQFSHSNLLCARTTRAIINYAPIGEDCLRFFPREEFHVHVVYTLSKLGNISCMTARDSTNIGILKGILYLIFCDFSNLTLMPFHLIRTLFCHIVLSITCVLFFSCFFSFHFSLFLRPSLFVLFWSCCFSLYVQSYEVATMVYPHTLCNKLLI